MTDTMPPIPAVGQLDWGDDLDACLTWLNEHVLTLEGQPNGAVMSFNFTDPAALRAAEFPTGTITFDSTDQEAATALLVSTTTEGGASTSLALASAVPGTVLVLQQSGDVNQYALATMSGDPVDMDDHFLLPVTNVRLASVPLRAGLTGLSAAGISSGVDLDLQAQVDANTASNASQDAALTGINDELTQLAQQIGDVAIANATQQEQIDALLARSAWVAEVDLDGDIVSAPSGWTAVKNADGDYTVTHNLGRPNLPMVSAVVSGSLANTQAWDDNSVQVLIVDSSNLLPVVSGFVVSVVGR